MCKQWMGMDTLDLWSVFVEVGDDDGEMLSEKTMSLVADRDWNA